MAGTGAWTSARSPYVSLTLIKSSSSNLCCIRCSGTGIPSTPVRRLRPDSKKLPLTRPGFISSSWRITSSGMFAGSCIGVILLVMSLEFLRRLGVEYDRYIAGQSRFISSRSRLAATKDSNVAVQEPVSSDEQLQGHQHGQACMSRRNARPTLVQHIVRSLLHMLQFGVAYFVMLLAMYYNGYFIICILIGSFLGYFVFSWQTMEKK